MARDDGIRTLLMTDVVGSTRLWSAHPDAMPEAILRLETLGGESVSAEGGKVVKSRGEGDSLFCVFPNPTSAARGARRFVAALRDEPWPSGLRLQVRAAIHCGAAHERDGDLYGPMPNRCARLREVGHPDQILLTGAARAQIGPEDGIALRDLGHHRLRDLDEPETIYQIVAEGLPFEFPPLRTLSLLRNNLPVQLTSFVGREALQRELRTRLLVDRLTTLTGVGGCGKTRLSLQLGADAIADFPGGVWFVELAEVGEAAGIARAMGAACGHDDLPERDALTTLIQRLNVGGKALFIVDNAEHIVRDVASAVGTLVANAPQVSVLVTSREPLRLRGEHVHKVPPLELPPVGCEDPVQIARTESAMLFVDRARLCASGFTLDRSNADATARVLRRVDGIPLCLEMVASHLDYLSPAEIAVRLDDRFSLLEDEGADTPARHRTMRETLAWQVDSLAAEERILLERLSLFAGLFELEAAERVGGIDPLRPQDVLKRLRALVEKSLVVAAPLGDATGYRLLEVVEQFASDLGGAEAALPAYVDWAARVAEETHRQIYGGDHEASIARVDRLYPSLRRAFERAVDLGDANACRIALNLTRYWMYRGLYGEGRRCAEAALPLSCEPDATARLSNAVGVFADRLGQPEDAERAYRQALSSDAALGAKLGAMTNLAILMNGQGRLDEAVGLYQEAIAAAASTKDDYTHRLATYNLGQAFLDLRRHEDGERTLAAAAEAFRRAGDGTRVALCHGALAGSAADRDDATIAAAHLRAALADIGPDPDAQLLTTLLLEAAWLARRDGDSALAQRLYAAFEARRSAADAKLEKRSEPRRKALVAALGDGPTDRLEQRRAEGRTADVPQVVEWIQRATRRGGEGGRL